MLIGGGVVRVLLVVIGVGWWWWKGLMSWAIFLACQKGLETQVIYCKLLVLPLRLILLLALFINSWGRLSLLRLIAFRHHLVLYLTKLNMTLRSSSLSQPHRSSVLLLLLATLRSHHHNLYLRLLFLPPDYLIDLRPTTTVPSRWLVPVRRSQIILAMLVWEKHLIFLCSSLWGIEIVFTTIMMVCTCGHEEVWF